MSRSLKRLIMGKPPAAAPARLKPSVHLDAHPIELAGGTIPQELGRLMPSQTVWSHRTMQFSHEVHAILNERIFDARMGKKIDPSFKDHSLSVLIESEWGWDYFAAEVVPFVANYILQVFNLLENTPSGNLSSRQVARMFCDFADWLEFNVTGAFHNVQTMADLIDTRAQMEDGK